MVTGSRRGGASAMVLPGAADGTGPLGHQFLPRFFQRYLGFIGDISIVNGALIDQLITRGQLLGTILPCRFAGDTNYAMKIGGVSSQTCGFTSLRPGLAQPVDHGKGGIKNMGKQDWMGSWTLYSRVDNAVGFITILTWICLRETLPETMVYTMEFGSSFKFCRKPIQWIRWLFWGHVIIMQIPWLRLSRDQPGYDQDMTIKNGGKPHSCIGKSGLFGVWDFGGKTLQIPLHLWIWRTGRENTDHNNGGSRNSAFSAEKDRHFKGIVLNYGLFQPGLPGLSVKSRCFFPRKVIKPKHDGLVGICLSQFHRAHPYLLGEARWFITKASSVMILFKMNSGKKLAKTTTDFTRRNSPAPFIARIAFSAYLIKPMIYKFTA